MSSVIVLKNQVTKIFCFSVFYVVSLTISLAIFPLLSLVLAQDIKLQFIKRKIIRNLFRIFLIFLRLAGFKIDIGDYKKYSNLKSTIVVANHPSLIDIIILMSAIPNVDCIVQKKLFSSFLYKGAIKNLFISSGSNPYSIIEECEVSLSNGNNLLIFPEGTRTKSNGIICNKLKRGAAQISLRTQRDILPIFIKTKNYVGLSKNDSVLKVHTKGYIYIFLIYKEIISISQYSLDNMTKSAKIITENIRNKIISEV